MQPDRPEAGFAVQVLLVLFCLAGAFTLVGVVADVAAQDGIGLAALVRERLPLSGVESAVTAVLLNFRGYDTLLEVGVLVLALIGLSSLRDRQRMPMPAQEGEDPLLWALSRTIVPVAVLAGGYLLWSGTHAPGGAFQAGAVLGAGAVLLHLAGFPLPAGLQGTMLRSLVLAGFLVFLASAGGVMAGGRRFLEYPSAEARDVIVLIETTLTASTACILAGLFVFSAPAGEGPALPPRKGGA